MSTTTETESDLFTELADALCSWSADASGPRDKLWMKASDLALQVSEHLNKVVTFLEWRKSHDYANGFQIKFSELYEQVHSFYDELRKTALDEDEVWEQVQLLEGQAQMLAEHVLAVRCLCRLENEAEAEGVQSPESDRQDASPYACINLKTRTITIGSLPYTPTADSIWTFLEELIADSERGIPTPKNRNKGQVDMLRKAIGKDGLRCIVSSSRDGYRLSPNVKVRR